MLKYSVWRPYATQLRRFSSLNDHIVMNAMIGMNEQQKKLYLDAKHFSDTVVRPSAKEWDQESIYPRELMKEFAHRGYGGMLVRKDVGGSQFSRKDIVGIVEALSTGSTSTAALVTIHNAGTALLDKFAIPSKRVEWVPALCSFEKMISVCITEPGAGSDAGSMQTRAVFDSASQEYVINGEKCFISGAGMSDLYIVFCRTSPQEITGIVVPKGTPGLSFGQNERKLGWKTQPTRQVRFENVRVPLSHRVGKEGQGFYLAMSALDGARLSVAACSIGAAFASMEIAINYLKKRGPIEQGATFLLADSFGKLSSARLLLRQAADLLDTEDRNSTTYCALAKLIATEQSSTICLDMMQLMGEDGLLSDHEVERFFRDIRVHQILEGTNEIMRHIVGRSIAG